MRSVVWKFPLQTTDVQRIRVPCGDGRDGGARFLRVHEQHGQLMLWALVDPQEKPMPFKVRIVGTGHHASDVSDMLYVGTVLTEGGALVWHVFVDAEAN